MRMIGKTTTAAVALAFAIALAACSNSTPSQYAGTWKSKDTSGADFEITLASDGSWDPALWISPGMCQADGSSCMDASDQMGNNAVERIMLKTTMGTTYYLVVDASAVGLRGPFTLSVQ